MTARTPAFFPTLRYRDPAAAIAFLRDAFGFGVHFIARAGDAADAPVVHAQMKLGASLLYLGPDNPDDAYGLHSPLALNGTNQCVCVGIENVDERFERAKAGGATIVSPPHDTPYGAREFSARDPEGHVWTFGNYWGEP